MSVKSVSKKPYAILAFVIICVIALTLRCIALGVDGFWLDEIFSSSFAGLSFFDLIIAVLRFDVHPPLYYLQLKTWSILSASDIWLMTNSIAWSMLTLLFASWGVYRLAGIRAAFIAATLLAVSGGEIYFAGELRMYAMLSCMVVLGWLCAERWLKNPDCRNTAILVLSLGVLSLLHSAAFISVSCILFYAVFMRVHKHGFRTILQSKALIFSAAIVVLPWVANASLRSVVHTTVPNLDTVAGTLCGWMLGYGALGVERPVMYLVFYLIVGVSLLALVLGSDAKRKAIVFFFVLYPIILVAGVSLLVRPIWIYRVVAFCAPFFAITFALLFESLLLQSGKVIVKRLAYVLGFILFATLMFVDIRQSSFSHKMQYREAAAYISENNSQQLPVYTYSNTIFWGIARYLGGPQWGSILNVQEPDIYSLSDTWARIYKKLGNEWLTKLHLIPSTRQITTSSGTLYMGFADVLEKSPSNGFWLISNNAMTPDNTKCGNNLQQEIWRFRGLVLMRCSR